MGGEYPRWTGCIQKVMKQGCALACLQNRNEASLAFHHIVNEGQRSRKVRVRVLVMRRSESKTFAFYSTWGTKPLEVFEWKRK